VGEPPPIREIAMLKSAVVCLAGLLLIACSKAPSEPPKVEKKNMIKEREPNDKEKRPQKTKKKLDKTTWYQIDGRFKSASDVDRYLFDVAEGVSAYRILAMQTEKGKLTPSKDRIDFNRFPITFIYYGKDGKELSQRELAASGGGADFPGGTTKIAVVVEGQQMDPEYNVPISYSANMPYRVFVKGHAD
jgi:hypothetical protein